MTVDLEQVRALSLQENGLATVATTRGDGTVHSSVVNAGVFDDPATGAPGVAYVAVGRAQKLALPRRGADAGAAAAGRARHRDLPARLELGLGHRLHPPRRAGRPRPRLRPRGPAE